MDPRRNTATAALLLAAMVATGAEAANWQVISAEQGKRIEIDRETVKRDAGGRTQVWGRITFDKDVRDPKSNTGYRIIEALNRYDCSARSVATLKRVYRRDEHEVLREEENPQAVDMPVRTGSTDDKLLREACRPKGPVEAKQAAEKMVAEVGAAAGDLRKANADLIRREVERASAKPAGTTKLQAGARPVALATSGGRAETLPASSAAVAPSPPRPQPRAVRPRPSPPAPIEPAVAPEPPPFYPQRRIQWAYEGEGRPENWGRLRPEYGLCASGERQSPIDIRDGIRVDQAPIEFDYKPSLFRILDNGHTVRVTVGAGRITVLGKPYDLVEVDFHRPAEERVNGRTFDMSAHLVHRSPEDGRTAVVVVLLEKGRDNPLIQTFWNNLPLERDDEVAPPKDVVDLNQLLPESRGYFAYMGSLTTPPCTEGVLWMVLRQPVEISAEQVAIFSRLYRNNARPIQPANGRLIKESR